jgi:selenocysteine lyase/cysteine desulfurase
LWRGGLGVLIVRAEVADEAALFLGGALVVEGDEAGEEGVFKSLPRCGRQ